MYRLFTTLSIEIAALCNRKCKFCPVGYNTRPDEEMEAALINKIALELQALKYRGRVELYIYNEPCRNLPHLLRTLAHLRSLVPRACLMVATNGDYLRGPATIDALWAAGLNQLLINCYSPGLYAKRLAWLVGQPVRAHGLYNYISPKTRTVHMLDKSTPEKFGTGVFSIINRAGNIPSFAPPTTAPMARMCVKPFRLLNINWKGEAMVCCNDYHGQVTVGNVATRTVQQLWASPVLNQYRKHLYHKDRSLPLCRVCDCHSGAYPHMVAPPLGPYATVKSIETNFKEVTNK